MNKKGKRRRWIGLFPYVTDVLLFGRHKCLSQLRFFFLLLFFFCVESYSFLTLNTPKASVLLCNASPISRLEWPKTQRISLLFFYWHLGPRCTQTDTKNNALESQLEGRMLCGNYEKSFVNCCLLTVSDRVRWIGRYTKNKIKGKDGNIRKEEKRENKKGHWFLISGRGSLPRKLVKRWWVLNERRPKNRLAAS